MANRQQFLSWPWPRFLTCLLFSLLLQVRYSESHYDPITKNLHRPGPLYAPTKGEPWPKPQLQANYGNAYVIIRPTLFKFKTVRNTCDLLEEAFKRYYSIILKSNGMTAVLRGQKHEHSSGLNGTNSGTASNHTWKDAANGFVGYLDTVEIDLMAPCEQWPHDEMDESYEIKINTPDLPRGALLIASSNWGILHALETFSQLIHPTDDFVALQVRSTIIVDYPRFSFRSLLLDTSRHFLSKHVIFESLDLMSMNKLNIFHWHIVDDQAFPYQSTAFPELSRQGAYHPYTHVYTPSDVAEIIEYARVRGIRVIPEFDTPGHTQSWGPGQPGFLTKCYNSKGKPDGTFGPIDVSSPENYQFLLQFFQEVAEKFPDAYVHLGGDEVDSGCWKSNPEIKDFMLQMNYSTDFTRLEDYHMQKLLGIVHSLNRSHFALVWQEVFDRKVNIDQSTIVHVWKGDDPYPYGEQLANITGKGYRAVLSAGWYLNYISYGSDWMDYYRIDPQRFNGTAAQKRLVLGGGPAMWGEMVDSTNLIPRTWPRASAPAERLWSHVTVNDTKEAAPRLEEHRCRLLRRGYAVQPPNGPSYCLVNWQS